MSQAKKVAALKRGNLTEASLVSLKISELKALFEREFGTLYPAHRPTKHTNRLDPWRQAILRAQQDWLRGQKKNSGHQLSLFDLGVLSSRSVMEEKSTVGRPSAVSEVGVQPLSGSDVPISVSSAEADNQSESTAFTGEPPSVPNMSPSPPAPPPPQQSPAAPDGEEFACGRHSANSSPEFSPSPQESHSMVLVEKSATETVARMEKWAYEFQLADSREMLEDIARRYNAFFGYDYETRKQQVWRMLSGQVKRRIKQLMAAITESEPAPQFALPSQAAAPVSVPPGEGEGAGEESEERRIVPFVFRLIVGADGPDAGGFISEPASVISGGCPIDNRVEDKGAAGFVGEPPAPETEIAPPAPPAPPVPQPSSFPEDEEDRVAEVPTEFPSPNTAGEKNSVAAAESVGGDVATESKPLSPDVSEGSAVKSFAVLPILEIGERINCDWLLGRPAPGTVLGVGFKSVIAQLEGEDRERHFTGKLLQELCRRHNRRMPVWGYDYANESAAVSPEGEIAIESKPLSLEVSAGGNSVAAAGSADGDAATESKPLSPDVSEGSAVKSFAVLPILEIGERINCDWLLGRPAPGTVLGVGFKSVIAQLEGEDRERHFTGKLLQELCRRHNRRMPVWGYDYANESAAVSPEGEIAIESKPLSLEVSAGGNSVAAAGSAGGDAATESKPLSPEAPVEGDSVTSTGGDGGASSEAPEPFPCWLTQAELEQAAALLELGFSFLGDADDWAGYTEECGKSGNWIFSVSPGEECSLEAECRGALYVKWLETDPDFDSEGFFERQLEAAKKAVEDTIAQQHAQQQLCADQQLSLFDLAQFGAPKEASIPTNSPDSPSPEHLPLPPVGCSTELWDSHPTEPVSKRQSAAPGQPEQSMGEGDSVAGAEWGNTGSDGHSFFVGQRVIVSLKAGKRSGTVVSAPYRPEGIACLLVRVRLDSGAFRNCPVEILEAVPGEGDGSLKLPQEMSAETLPTSPVPASVDLPRELDRENTSSTASAQEEMLASAGSITLEVWKRELEEALTAESILQLAARYRAAYGNEYDDRKKEVWSLLSVETRTRIRGLRNSGSKLVPTVPALSQSESSCESADSNNVPVLSTGHLSQEDILKKIAGTPLIPSEVKRLARADRVWEVCGAGDSVRRLGKIEGLIRWIKCGVREFHFIWRVPVRWDGKKKEDIDALFIEPFPLETSEVEGSSAAKSAKVGLAKERWTAPGQRVVLTEQFKGKDKGVSGILVEPHRFIDGNFIESCDTDFFEWWVVFDNDRERALCCSLAILEPEPELASDDPTPLPNDSLAELPQAPQAKEGAVDSSNLERSPERSTCDPKTATRLNKLEKRAAKYAQLAKLASKLGCRRCAIKWLFKALKIEQQIEQELNV